MPEKEVLSEDDGSREAVGAPPALHRWNILHVHTQPVISGSGINTLLTLRGSLQRGHRVALACGSLGPLTDAAERAGASVHVIPSLQNAIRPVEEIRAVWNLRQLARIQHFDLVHTHNSKAGFIGRLAARLAGTPLILHTVHGFAFHDAEKPWRRALFRKLERVAAGWCDGMIFISRPLVEWARRERIGPGTPQALIYSGIDVEAYRAADGSSFRREMGVADGTLLVGMVSKLWEGKGHDVLLRAWKGLLDRRRPDPPPVLAIVGEGELRVRLEAMAEELGIAGSVRFTGFRADVPEVTAALDASVLPSLFEGMGRVILEAMAAGKPVVASKTGGIPDLVRHGENGLLVQPGSPASLETALEQILTDPSLRSRLGAGAARSLRPEHSADRMVSEIHRFYDEIARRKARGRGMKG